jgi:hypothetical protein
MNVSSSPTSSASDCIVNETSGNKYLVKRNNLLDLRLSLGSRREWTLRWISDEDSVFGKRLDVFVTIGHIFFSERL